MSHRVPMHHHPRAITLDLGIITETIGGDDSSTAAPTAAASSSSDSSSTKKSKASKSTKDVTSSDSSAPSTGSSITLATSTPTISTTSSSMNQLTSTFTASSLTLPAESSTSAPSATTSAAASSSHSSHTSPGLVAFAVLISLAFVGAIAWVLVMRRHAKQREWTFQQHQRIFERFDKSNNTEDRPTTSQTVESIYPPMPPAVIEDGHPWSAGTGASIIVTGPSVVRKLDWDQGPEKSPQEVIEKPKRKPVPPPKEFKKKTFSQYLPYLLPQNHSAEVIELGKAQQQLYQRPTYKPAG